MVNNCHIFSYFHHSVAKKEILQHQQIFSLRNLFLIPASSGQSPIANLEVTRSSEFFIGYALLV